MVMLRAERGDQIEIVEKVSTFYPQEDTPRVRRATARFDLLRRRAAS